MQQVHLVLARLLRQEGVAGAYNPLMQTLGLNALHVRELLLKEAPDRLQANRWTGSEPHSLLCACLAMLAEPGRQPKFPAFQVKEKQGASVREKQGRGRRKGKLA